MHAVLSRSEIGEQREQNKEESLTVEIIEKKAV